MTGDRVRVLALLGLIAVLAGVAAIVWSVALGQAQWEDHVGVVITILGFGAVGYAVALRAPTNPIGWLLLGFAATLAVRTAGEEALSELVLSNPALARLVVVATLALESLGAALLVSLAVLFPAGRVTEARWRRALMVVWMIAAIGVLLAPFGSYEGTLGQAPSLVPSSRIDGIRFPLLLPTIGVLFAAMVRIVRLRVRGSLVEQLQIRWVSFVLTLTLALIALAGVWTPAADIASVLVGIGIPVTIGIAVTRYRMFDLDRLVSRTVSYAVVVAVLVVAFGILVVGPTVILGRADDGASAPSWAVALSTLVVFAAFNPLRRRVQVIVDRRFNRSGYDSERLVTALGVRMLGNADTETLVREVGLVVGSALHPAALAIWIHPPSGRPRLDVDPEAARP